MITLKNQLKQLKTVLNNRETELAEIYRSVKYTKIHELEVRTLKDLRFVIVIFRCN